MSFTALKIEQETRELTKRLMPFITTKNGRPNLNQHSQFVGKDNYLDTLLERLPTLPKYLEQQKKEEERLKKQEAKKKKPKEKKPQTSDSTSTSDSESSKSSCSSSSISEDGIDVETAIELDNELRRKIDYKNTLEALVKKGEELKKRTGKSFIYEKELIIWREDQRKKIIEETNRRKEKLSEPLQKTKQEKQKKTAYENLEEKKTKAAKDALEGQKFYKDIAPQRIPQRFVDEQERQKKAEMQKSLTAAWDDQVEYKRQKKIEMEKMKKQELHSLMESDRTHRMEEVEKKKEKQQRFKPIIREEIIRQREIFQSVGDPKEGFQSTSVFVTHKSQSRFPELVPSPEDCKNIGHKKPVCYKIQETLPAAAPERSRSKPCVGSRTVHSADKPNVHVCHKPEVHFGYKPKVHFGPKPDVHSPEIEDMRLIDKQDVLLLGKHDEQPTHKHHKHSTHTHDGHLPHTHDGHFPHRPRVHSTRRYYGHSTHRHHGHAADKHDDIKSSAPLLSHEKVSSTEPARLPLLKSKSVRFCDNSPQSSKNVKFPSITRID